MSQHIELASTSLGATWDLPVEDLLRERPNGEGVASLPVTWLYQYGLVTPATIRKYAGSDRDLEAAILTFVPQEGQDFDFRAARPVVRTAWRWRYR